MGKACVTPSPFYVIMWLFQSLRPSGNFFLKNTVSYLVDQKIMSNFAGQLI